LSNACSGFNSYNYEEVWGGTKEEAIDKVRMFYESDHFSERMQTVPGALEALKVREMSKKKLKRSA
jgi:hypothetical protein